MTRIINIVGHSGSGKSVLTFNLGVALANKGLDVILLDSNIYSPDLTNYSNISPSAYLNEFLDNEIPLENTITYHPSGVKIIPSIAEEVHNDYKHSKINHALLSLIGKSEIVLVDTNSLVMNHFDNSDETILISNDDFHSIMKTKDYIDRLEKMGANITGIVINKKGQSKKQHLESITGKKVLAEIFYDKKMIESVNKRQPLFLVYPKSKTAKSISYLADIVGILNEKR